MNELKVIKFIGEPRKGMTLGKLYAVETDEDYIDWEVFEDFGAYTVFDDDGHLHEICKDEYEVIEGTTERDWFNARSEKRYIELL